MQKLIVLVFLSLLPSFGFCCSANCATCTTNGADYCDPTGCNTNYEYNTTTMFCDFICAINCATCVTSGAGKCDTCLSGYELNPSSSICDPVNNTISCPQYCSQCSGTICTDCIQGYGLAGQVCMACPSNCRHCVGLNGSATFNCTQCVLDGYYSVNDNGGGVMGCSKGMSPDIQALIFGVTLGGVTLLGIVAYLFISKKLDDRAKRISYDRA